MKKFTKKELLNYSSNSKIIYVALNGTVYDVSKEKRFYGKVLLKNLFFFLIKSIQKLKISE